MDGQRGPNEPLTAALLRAKENGGAEAPPSHSTRKKDLDLAEQAQDRLIVLRGERESGL